MRTSPCGGPHQAEVSRQHSCKSAIESPIVSCVYAYSAQADEHAFNVIDRLLTAAVRAIGQRQRCKAQRDRCGMFHGEKPSFQIVKFAHAADVTRVAQQSILAAGHLCWRRADA